MAKHITQGIVDNLVNKNYAKKASRRLLNTGIFDRESALSMLRNYSYDFARAKLFSLDLKDSQQVPLYLIQNCFFDLQSQHFTRNIGATSTYQSTYNHLRNNGMLNERTRSTCANAIDRRNTLFESFHTVISRQVHNLRHSISTSTADILLDLLYKKPERLFILQKQVNPSRGTYADVAFTLGNVENNNIYSSLVGFKSGNFEVNFGHLVDITRQKVLMQFTINEEFIEYYMLNKLIDCPEELIPEIFTIYIDKDFYEGTDGIYSKELAQVVKKGFLNVVDSKIPRVFMEGISYYSSLYSKEIKPPFKASIVATISENATAQEAMFENYLLKKSLLSMEINLVD